MAVSRGGSFGSGDLFDSAAALAGRLKARDLSCVEAVTACLERIASANPALNAFTEVHADQALDRARGLDGAPGARRLPLFGVPLAVKDNFDCAGRPTRAGSMFHDPAVRSRSADAVEALEAAGAIIIGRTAMVEFAFGGWGAESNDRITRNPADGRIARVAGGSSGGSAAAVAAGLVPCALGTDTGGSIRLPAAWCGIVGVRPSSALVSRRGVVPLSPSLDAVGPMTRSVADAALLLKVLSGARPGAPPPSPSGAGWSIGVVPDAVLERLDPPVRGAYRRAAELLAGAGAVRHEIDLSPIDRDAQEAAFDIMCHESHQLLGGFVEAADGGVHGLVAERIMRGRTISPSRHRHLLETRSHNQSACRRGLSFVDAILLPVARTVAPELACLDIRRSTDCFHAIVNYLDLAAVAVPVGLSAHQMPVGVQVVSGNGGDWTALALAALLERLAAPLKGQALAS